MARRSPALPAPGVPGPAVPDCVGYVRVSTERQAGETVTSLADQVTAIEALARRLGTTVARWFRDEGFSGATIERRPAFLELLAFCEGEARRTPVAPGRVLVLNDSRFGRFPDPDQAAALRYRLKQAGWIVRFAESDETEDVTTRSIMRALGSAQATVYREQLQKNARRGARGAAEQGFWQTEAPLGYRRAVVYPPPRAGDAPRMLDVGVRKGALEKVALVPGPEAEVAFVQWMFEAYASGGYTLYTLAQACLERWPARHWSRRHVQALLQNPAYVGDVVWGRRPAAEGPRQQHPTVPMAHWYGKRDAHPPLVSRALFAECQARFALNQQRTRAAVTTGYALSGLVTCTACGEQLIGGGGRSERFRVYLCRGTMVLPRVCPPPSASILRRKLDRAVIDLVAAEVRHPSVQLRIGRELARVLRAAQLAPTGEAERLAAKLADLEGRRDRLVRLMTQGTVQEAEGASLLAGFRDEIARVTAAHAQATFAEREQASSAIDLEAEHARLVRLAMDFPAVAERLLAAGDGAALRELLAPWVHSATFDKTTRDLIVQIRRLPSPQTAASVLESASRPGRG